MIRFSPEEIKKLWIPKGDSRGEDNGQVTIIGGSKLFHGAPILSLKAASRTVDMVFFSSPEPAVGETAALIKAALSSFIWVPWEETESYIRKSDAVLIGPGMMRYHSENIKLLLTDDKILDDAGKETKTVTQFMLGKFPNKQWVIDGGSLQVMKPEWIPEKAILTPNTKEYEMLFNEKFTINNLQLNAKKYRCVVVYKGPVGYVTDGMTTYEIDGGNAGLTKGGTGDTLAGLTVGLAAKNPPLIAAASASYIVKKAAENLELRVGLNFNADDVAENIFSTLKSESSR
jgi:hydroxyethylthiazole kinase-like uncharacterized protein yjeF